MQYTYEDIKDLLKDVQENLLIASTYCYVVQDLILSLDDPPFDDDYMKIYWETDVADFIYYRFKKINAYIDEVIKNEP